MLNKEGSMQIQDKEQADAPGTGDGAAVSELVSDIEAELRLHQMRVQEFLDGTKEFAAIVGSKERSRLLRLSQALSSALLDLSDLA